MSLSSPSRNLRHHSSPSRDRAEREHDRGLVEQRVSHGRATERARRARSSGPGTAWVPTDAQPPSCAASPAVPRAQAAGGPPRTNVASSLRRHRQLLGDSGEEFVELVVAGLTGPRDRGQLDHQTGSRQDRAGGVAIATPSRSGCACSASGGWHRLRSRGSDLPPRAGGAASWWSGRRHRPRYERQSKRDTGAPGQRKCPVGRTSGRRSPRRVTSARRALAGSIDPSGRRTAPPRHQHVSIATNTTHARSPDALLKDQG